MEKISWKEKQKEQLRVEIVTVALKLFEQKGFDAVSVDEITKSTGIAKGTFYLYFKTKADVICATLDEGLALLEDAVASAKAETPINAGERLRAIVRAQFAFFEEHHSIVAITLGGSGFFATSLSAEAWERLRTRYRAATSSTYEETICAAQTEGLYRDLDPHIAAHALYGVIIGLMYDRIESGKPFTEIADAALDIFEKGVIRNA